MHTGSYIGLTTLEYYAMEIFQGPKICRLCQRDGKFCKIKTTNTELAIHALDQVHCWNAYFRLRIGHFENFTPLNFQPLLFSKQ
jgi:hypothetical protein